MKFRYFAQPDQYGHFLEDATVCEICNEEKKCFDAETFYGEDTIAAICMDCLAGGRLEETDLSTCEGDVEELERQIRKNNPGFSTKEVSGLVAKKTSELEKTTPKLITWQDWTWPCADGDYCTFIGFGTKPLYNQLAKDGNGKGLFDNSIYYNQEEETDVDDLWEESMPDTGIKNIDDTEEHSVLFYVFKSIHSDAIVTIWDME